MQLVERFYSELWNDRNAGAIDSILAKDVSFRGSLGDEKQGHTGFLEYVNKVHTALSDYRCTIEKCLEYDQTVRARVEFSGIHRSDFLGVPPTGKRITWTGEATFRFSGSLISAVYVQADLNALQEQLGGTET